MLNFFFNDFFFFFIVSVCEPYLINISQHLDLMPGAGCVLLITDGDMCLIWCRACHESFVCKHCPDVQPKPDLSESPSWNRINSSCLSIIFWLQTVCNAYSVIMVYSFWLSFYQHTFWCIFLSARLVCTLPHSVMPEHWGWKFTW